MPGPIAHPAKRGGGIRSQRGRVAFLILAGIGVVFASGVAVHAQDTPQIAEGKVNAELDQRSDVQIAKRLKATFSNLEILAPVSVAVEAGIVRLSGIVDSADASSLAGELAQQVEGVVAVKNDIQENRSLDRRLSLATERVGDRPWSLLDSLPLLIVALFVLAASIVLGRVVASWDGLFRWLSKNIFLQDLTRQVARIGIFLAGALVALEIMDATALVGAVIGAAGVVGLAIGFAFRDLVENYLASILLSLRRPFSPRDFVRIGDHEGYVSRLTSRATILVTPDGNHVRIPNGVVFKATIENVTRNPNRRFSFGVGVGVEEELVVAQDLGTGILKKMDGVLDDPAPYCRVEELGDSSVSLQFYGWVDQKQADFGKVRSEAIRLVKQAFDRMEIEMPEPIHRVRVESMEKLLDSVQDEIEPGKTTDGRARDVDVRADDRVRDITPDRHIEDFAAAEQAASEEDLLTESNSME